MPSNVIGAKKKKVSSFTLGILKTLSYFRGGKPIETNTIIWTPDASDMQKMREMRKDGDVIKPDNQWEHSTGAGGGWNQREEQVYSRKLAGLGLILRKATSRLKEKSTSTRVCRKVGQAQKGWVVGCTLSFEKWRWGLTTCNACSSVPSPFISISYPTYVFVVSFLRGNKPTFWCS